MRFLATVFGGVVLGVKKQSGRVQKVVFYCIFILFFEKNI
jgi:hypothetical protein